MSTSVNMGGTAEPGFVPWGQGFFDGRKTWGGCMFQEVDPRQSFPELEQEIMQWWDEQNIVQKAHGHGDRKRPFVFFEGPPTANGRPGVHHQCKSRLSSLRDSGLKSGNHKGIQARSDDGAVAKATVSFPRMRYELPRR